MKYLTGCILLLSLSCSFLKAQVGINTTDPHESSALEVRSQTKGLLIPRLTSLQRDNVDNPADGLLVYDTDEKKFYFWDASDGQWLAVNPWHYQAPNTDGSLNEVYLAPATNLGIGTDDPEAKLHVVGTTKLEGNTELEGDLDVNGAVAADNFTGDGSSVTNVDAVTLESHPASYFGTAEAVLALDTSKADKESVEGKWIKLTVTAHGYGDLNYDYVYACRIGNMTFIRGTVSFKKTRSENGMSIDIAGDIPPFTNAFGAGATSFPCMVGENGYSSRTGLAYYYKSGTSNRITFYQPGGGDLPTRDMSANFQFFYLEE